MLHIVSNDGNNFFSTTKVYLTPYQQSAPHIICVCMFSVHLIVLLFDLSSFKHFLKL